MKILAKWKVNNRACYMVDAYKDHYGQPCAVVVFDDGEVEEVLFKDLIVIDADFIPKKEIK